MTWPAVELDVFNAGDPVSLLDRTLQESGGVVRAAGRQSTDNIFFHPSGALLSEFHAAERAGTLENYNTQAAEQLFRQSVFTLTGDAHRRSRAGIVRYFGSRGGWRGTVHAAVQSWVETVSREQTFDLLDQTRRLAREIFTRVVFSLDPQSARGIRIAQLTERFVAGAIAAADPEVDPAILDDAMTARDELVHVFVLVSGDRASFASHARPAPAGQINAHDVGAILVASVETTGNLLGWSIARWLNADPASRKDIPGLAREVERVHSPNTLVTRRVVTPFVFAGEELDAGTLLSYSPAADTRHAPPAGRSDQTRSVRATAPITFGFGRRACPGRSMAQFVIQRTLATMAAGPVQWALVANELPRAVSWFPVQTFGKGTRVRTTTEAS